ncbi:helix-turn-helix domain-containing protein [Jiangella alba]|uniref:DNA binding domain-containing protein, excisionase family n=1 Tax=Jiangella alba TaxID=561176 RepID=A0A1H5MZK8_9ACTN|nr:helix-turn-helix domain-containing protein [Jiangella alba]SEE94782.1 DNA binding domain-containing protein, excisionase family [Jiangella alba]
MAPVVRASATHLAGMDDMAETSGPWGLEPLMDVEELAEYLGVPVTTIYDWRTNGKGPPAYRFGKRLKFAVSDVRAWLAAQREPGSG